MLKNPEHRFVLIAGTLLVLVAGFFLFSDLRVYNTTTFVDAIPPEEFMTTANDRRPSSHAPMSAGEIVRSRRKFDDLSRPERRSLYNAVMYFCNEERDDRVCKTYLAYCGKNCQLLVQGPSAAR